MSQTIPLPVTDHPVDARLRPLVAAWLGVPEDRLHPERPLEELGDVDLDALALLLSTEMDVHVPDFALERLRTWGDVVRIVRVCSWARTSRRAA